MLIAGVASIAILGSGADKGSDVREKPMALYEWRTSNIGAADGDLATTGRNPVDAPPSGNVDSRVFHTSPG